MSTNIYLYDNYYCKVSEEEQKEEPKEKPKACSNDINSNLWILGLYLLFILYFYVSAI